MSTNEPTPRKPLRLWPGVATAVLLVLVGYVMPIVTPQYAGYGLMGAPLLGLIIILWWLLFSRARWYERLAALPLIILAAIVAHKYVVHPSIAGGAMGYMTFFLAIPTLTVALVGWAAASRGLAPAARGGAAIVALVLGCLPWAIIRTGGISNNGKTDFHFRWTKTPEELLLAQADDPKPLPAPAAAAVSAAPPVAAPAAEPAKEPEAPVPVVPAKVWRPAEWPGFRGPDRNSVIHGVQIATDWSASPPAQLWRRPVGPGWSSFAVNGDLFYTQEQRGGDEVVSCYRVSTGEPVWRHRDATRFWESNAGAGPRGTPTLSNGRVYTLGATGIVNVLQAGSGAVVWSRNAAKELNAKVPFWGISSSPVVVDDVVIVAAGGKLGGYELETGKLRWSGGGGGFSYSSPHLVTIDGVPQVLFISGPGTTSVVPSTGKVLWEHKWEGGAIVQPAITADGDVVVNAMAGASGAGIRRIAVAHTGDKWTAAERWTSTGLKPYFNDFVLHKGYAYGFDNNILSCVDLQDGTRKWKGGRYGSGQLVLLADQDLLLVISEEGELALVKATPDQFTEVAKVPALDGKTWNHPVVIRDLLLVRNDHEMAAYRLTLARTLTETRQPE
jgi:outer membrane protein assembly factor BamB